MAASRGAAMVLAVLLLMASATSGHAIETGGLTRLIVIAYINNLDFDVRVTISNPQLLGQGETVNDIPANGKLVATVEVAVATSTDFRFTVRKDLASGSDVTYITAGPTVPKALSSSGVQAIIDKEKCTASDRTQGLSVRLRPKPLGRDVNLRAFLESKLCLQKLSS